MLGGSYLGQAALGVIPITTVTGTQAPDLISTFVLALSQAGVVTVLGSTATDISFVGVLSITGYNSNFIPSHLRLDLSR